MSRKLASIVEIASCDPIPDTDRLSVAKMVGKGWQVICGRDEFHTGQLCVYFEIDSALNPDDERYAFLRERCLRKFTSKSGNVVYQVLRIKSIKLRGVVSQGLLMPLDKFPEITDNIVWNEEKQSDEWIDGSWLIGKDVTDLLHVEHYDEVWERMQPVLGNPVSADVMGSFPALIPRTDEERLQNLGDWFQLMKGRLWQVSVKHDGTSCTIAYAPSIDPSCPEIVCGRNKRFKPISNDGQISIYWQMANKFKIHEKLKQMGAKEGSPFVELAIQGEIVGPGIQKDRNKEKEHTFKCFRIWNITDQKWLSPAVTESLCKKYDIPHVEILERNYPFFDKITTIEEALKFAEGKTAEGNEREGIVCKTNDAGEYTSFKVVSNRYLLKCED